MPVGTSNLVLQFENFGYAYLSKLLAYIMMLQTKKLVINQEEFIFENTTF